MQKKCHHAGVKSFQHHCSLGQFTLVQNWHRLVIELLVIHHQSRLALLDDFLAVAALGRRDGCFDSESDVFPSLAATFPSLEQPLTPFCCCAVTLSNLASWQPFLMISCSCVVEDVAAKFTVPNISTVSTTFGSSWSKLRTRVDARVVTDGKRLEPERSRTSLLQPVCSGNWAPPSKTCADAAFSESVCDAIAGVVVTGLMGDWDRICKDRIKAALRKSADWQGSLGDGGRRPSESLTRGCEHGKGSEGV
jgi:hypothetical protein